MCFTKRPAYSDIFCFGRLVGLQGKDIRKLYFVLVLELVLSLLESSVFDSIKGVDGKRWIKCHNWKPKWDQVTDRRTDRMTDRQ